jgi:hypothetical protein
MSNFNTHSLANISRSKLHDFLNLSNSCSSKCNTITSDSSSSSSLITSSKHKSKSRRHKSKLYNSSSCKSNCYSSSCSTSSSCPSSSSSCPSSSSSCSSCHTSSSSCPTSSSSCSSCHTSSSSCSCKNKCPSYALKCNTYKSISGTVLIPGPQGPSTGSLANFSGISDNIQESSSVITYSIYNSQVNITDSNGTLTFNLSGKYLFQYNITVDSATIIQLTQNGITNFGIQTVGNAGNYGCSVIQYLNANDTVILNISDNDTYSFASLTVIKL